MLTRQILAIFLVVFASLAPATAQAPQNDSLVVLGQRIGPVSVGMTAAQLVQLLGAPDQSRGPGAKNGYQHDFNRVGLTAFVVDGYVEQVWTHDSRYHTASGAHVDMSELELVASMGNPTWKRSLNPWDVVYCYRPNTQFLIGGPRSDKAGRVTTIAIGACETK